jgi:hypothetical protein
MPSERAMDVALGQRTQGQRPLSAVVRSRISAGLIEAHHASNFDDPLDASVCLRAVVEALRRYAAEQRGDLAWPPGEWLEREAREGRL